MDFRVATADLGKDASSVVVTGEVDLSTAPELKELLTGVIDGGARFVLVDLSDATFIDSTTLGVLMGAITLLDRVFAIFDSPDEGVTHIRDVARVEHPDVSPAG